MDILSTTTSSFLTTGLPSLSVLEAFQQHWLWALIVCFHLSFLFAFAMGANEVSNAFATSVASGAISLRVAYVCATFVESAGGILLGYKVLETLRFGVIDLPMYEKSPQELLVGQVAILIGCSFWMFSATLCGLPVSSTHAHVGSIIGFSLAMRGAAGLHLGNVTKIIVSWIASPVLSGIISAIIYVIFDFAVFRRKNPLEAGFRSMPFFYFAVFTFNTFVVVYQGSKWIGFDKTPFWLAIVVSLAVGVLSAIVFQWVVRPYLVKWVHNAETTYQEATPPTELGILNTPATMESKLRKNKNNVVRIDSNNPAEKQEFSLMPKKFVHWLLPNRTRIDDAQTLRLFSAIQVFTGCFTGFSHGSKDIPNTIAPLATLLFVYEWMRVPSPQETPLWILAYGSFGTCVGFWMLGHRVIHTVGRKFTEVNSFCGFTVEIGSAITVLIASKLGIPVSLSLCIVGSIVAVGAVRGSVPVNWALFRNVFIAWVVTFPSAGLLSAAAMFLLKWIFL